LTSTALGTKLLAIKQLLHPTLKSTMCAPWPNFQLCPSSQQILATPLTIVPYWQSHHHIADLQSRAGLRPAISTSKYQTSRTRIKFGERGFSYAGPSAWNTFPGHVQQMTNTTTFKRHLKTVFFRRAFLDW